LFAFDSDLATPGAEQDRWMASDEMQAIAVPAETGWSRLELPLLRVVCVVSAGYGYYSLDIQSYGWRDTGGDHDEVLWYMAGIANSIPALIRERRELPFGHYFAVSP
jgi:hypothetical protein